MLLGSSRAVSAWSGNELVGFGRATSDGVYRAVLWDVLVAEKHRGKGIGTSLVENLVNSKGIREAEKIYLMTTNSASFYLKLGFHQGHRQDLMVKNLQQITNAVPPSKAGEP